VVRHECALWRLPLALVGLLAVTGCSPEEVATSVRTGVLCALIGHPSSAADFTPEHQTFGGWTTTADGERRIVGYSASEGSSVWSLPECAIASSL